MATQDTVVTICPWFRVHEGKMDAFKALCERFVAQTETESTCYYYGFSFHDGLVFCREGYEGAAGALAHLENVDGLIKEALEIADIERFELHGPASELDQLREPLAALSPDFFELEYGFKR